MTFFFIDAPPLPVCIHNFCFLIFLHTLFPYSFLSFSLLKIKKIFFLFLTFINIIWSELFFSFLKSVFVFLPFDLHNFFFLTVSHTYPFCFLCSLGVSRFSVLSFSCISLSLSLISPSSLLPYFVSCFCLFHTVSAEVHAEVILYMFVCVFVCVVLMLFFSTEGTLCVCVWVVLMLFFSLQKGLSVCVCVSMLLHLLSLWFFVLLLPACSILCVYVFVCVTSCFVFALAHGLVFFLLLITDYPSFMSLSVLRHLSIPHWN